MRYISMQLRFSCQLKHFRKCKQIIFLKKSILMKKNKIQNYNY